MINLARLARTARDGDTILIPPGDHTAQVAVWPQNRLTIKATGTGARILAAGAHAQGKAIWVVQGHQVVIEGITFEGAVVPDHNGAGIRHEGGDLTLLRCGFFHNQMGVLTAATPYHLRVETCEFGFQRSGGAISHGLYVGAMKSLEVLDSHFHNGQHGHLIKSRAGVNLIHHNRLDDGPTGQASYELDLPNGGLAHVVGNLIRQSAQTQNHALVAFGLEGYKHPRNELHLAHNTFISDVSGVTEPVRCRDGADVLTSSYNHWRLGPAGPLRRLPLLRGATEVWRFGEALG